MSLFSTFQSLWSGSGDASSLDSSSATAGQMGPVVNIDGTPMLNATVDIHGHLYGVTADPTVDWSTTQDTNWLDCSHDVGGFGGMDSNEG